MFISSSLSVYICIYFIFHFCMQTLVFFNIYFNNILFMHFFLTICTNKTKTKSLSYILSLKWELSKNQFLYPLCHQIQLFSNASEFTFIIQINIPSFIKMLFFWFFEIHMKKRWSCILGLIDVNIHSDGAQIPVFILFFWRLGHILHIDLQRGGWMLGGCSTLIKSRKTILYWF